MHTHKNTNTKKKKHTHTNTHIHTCCPNDGCLEVKRWRFIRFVNTLINEFKINKQYNKVSKYARYRFQEDKYRKIYTSSAPKEGYILLPSHTSQTNPLSSSFYVQSTRKTIARLDLEPYKIFTYF